MLVNFLLTREEIVSIIKSSPKTKDGIYWCPRFDCLNHLKGTVPENNPYYYSRIIFNKKMFFTENEISVYLSKKKVLNFDETLFCSLTTDFWENNKNLIFLDVNELVPGNQFTVCDLVDTYCYIKDIV